MRTFSLIKYYKKLLKSVTVRKYCTATKTDDIENIRNIGILAHIDAGKTTTTERMLFYSGTIRSMGEVHHGNTVTDYMEQERQRGITITSAAVSFPWQGYQINLIDTPGHIDFTMEVEQSLAVLDGAVVVLDGSAGVEAQTLTVWRQAEGYRVPRMLYLNKMDRADSDAAACLRDIQDKLHATPLPLHAPLRHDGRLIGLIDLVTCEEIVWIKGRGQNLTRRKLTEEKDGKKWEDTMITHTQLVDTLSSLDDKLADIIIQQESLHNLEQKDLVAALRRCTLDMKGFPVLCGSSYKNLGVQTLLDGVVSYLPSPLQCNDLYKSFGSDLVARSFKVQHDDQRGVLTFLRLYGGKISKGQKIYNLARDKSEQIGGLYVALADEFKPVEVVTAGNIAVVSALKSTMSGDLVTSTAAAAQRAQDQLKAALARGAADRLMLPAARQRLQALPESPSPDELVGTLLGIGTTVPEPVFLCSIEPPSAGQQGALELALAELAREDPSLRVTTDGEAGQTVLAGMGELHLEIIKERIIREYKIDVELGPLQIAYREALNELEAEAGEAGKAQCTLAVDRSIGGARQQLKLTMSARSRNVSADKVLRLSKAGESAANLSSLHPRHLAAVRRGVLAALRHGPKLGCPLVDVEVTLHWFEAGRGTSDSVITATTVQCLRKVFSQVGSVVLEPVMTVEVSCPESHSARVLADLARRRADVLAIELRNQHKVRAGYRAAEPAQGEVRPSSCGTSTR
ncbi:hypothetical protein ACJJTC_001094 [Scirpophaga incertulas]